MNDYLFMIIIVTNPKCQITQQSRIDNSSKNSDLENSDLQNLDHETSDPLKNNWNCKCSSTWMNIYLWL